jgi:hypothetical protein
VYNEDGTTTKTLKIEIESMDGGMQDIHLFCEDDAELTINGCKITTLTGEC